MVSILFWEAGWLRDFLKCPLTRTILWLHCHRSYVMFKKISCLKWPSVTTMTFLAFCLCRIEYIGALIKKHILKFSYRKRCFLADQQLQNMYCLSLSDLLLWRIQDKTQGFVITFANLLCPFNVKGNFTFGMKRLFLQRENSV